jgi:hypothetical protein
MLGPAISVPITSSSSPVATRRKDFASASESGSTRGGCQQY